MKPKKDRYSMTMALVAFVFVILLVSSTLVSAAYLVLIRLGVFRPEMAYHFPFPLMGLLVASVAIATSLTALTGGSALRSLRKLSEATDEISAGNFDVRVNIKAPHELEKLARSFNRMAKELGGIETLRNDFVTNVSHEFRTPVMSIRGFAKLLRKDSLSAETRQEYLDIIIRESDRLARLSENVLLLTKLEHQETAGPLDTFALDEQIRRCILMLEAEWTHKELDMEINLPAQSYTGNEALLQQVWLNLIDNAVKFTGRQGIVTISLGSDERAVTVSISDTGVGIDDETRERLFDKFYQGDKSRSMQGNGLGLSLVKRIVDLCEGTIRVESKPSEGSTFLVSLPLRGADQHGPRVTPEMTKK